MAYLRLVCCYMNDKRVSNQKRAGPSTTKLTLKTLPEKIFRVLFLMYSCFVVVDMLTLLHTLSGWSSGPFCNTLFFFPDLLLKVLKLSLFVK